MTKKDTRADKSLAAERQAQVREIIRGRRFVRVEDLCRELAVSAATVRRDLDELEARRLIRRVHGGAMSVESMLDEPLFDDKAQLAPEEKKRIAAAAADLIRSNETIYLDGGSTVLELGRMLMDRTDITVVTNSLRLALELSGRGPRLMLLGGELRRRSQTMVGALSGLVLKQLHVDKAFMGTIGLTVEQGLTTTDADEAYTKELVLHQAGEVILLADSRKVGVVSFANAGRLEQVQHVISDRKIPAEFAKELKRRSIKLTMV